jgi:hypothetical protein
MNSYDPDRAPNAERWLQADEAARLELVTHYHRQQRIPLPNENLHAVIHVVVENQLAMGESAVVAALARLQSEGLTRHDAIHAIGLVLSEYLYVLMHEGASARDTAYADYVNRLGSVSAASWRGYAG